MMGTQYGMNTDNSPQHKNAVRGGCRLPEQIEVKNGEDEIRRAVSEGFRLFLRLEISRKKSGFLAHSATDGYNSTHNDERPQNAKVRAKQ